MRFRLLAIVMLVMFTIGASVMAQDESAAALEYRIIGYYPSWSVYDREYLVSDVPAEMLTHINYAFARISDAGEIALMDEQADTQFAYPTDTDDQPLKGNFNALQVLKEAHPHLQTLISVGGWTDSAKFSDVALTAESRNTFARSAVDFMIRYGFDGVDIDWEYPTGGGDPGNIERPDDPENFILLLDALRTALDTQGDADGRHYLLTIAAGAGRTQYEPLDWTRIHPLLDWINVMTYDISGGWSSVTGFNAPLYDSAERPPEGTSVDTSLQGYLAAGIPPEKLVMGIPFYGRGWGGVPRYNDGLHQPHQGVPDGDGSFLYRELVSGYIGTFTRFWSDEAQVPWLYDETSRIMISYDDPESLAAKAEYVRENSLGGIMIWALGQDTDDNSLLTAISEGLSE